MKMTPGKHADWVRRYREGRAQWSTDPSHTVVRTESAIAACQAPGSALDLACGTGRNAMYLARRGWNVTALDFAEPALELARERAHEQGLSIQWMLQDLLEWYPPVEAFDLAMICYLHLPWQWFRRILSRAEQALRPGGVLLVVGHDRINITEGTGKPKHMDVAYTPDEVAGALAWCTVERAERDRYVREFQEPDAPGTMQIDCVVQARRRNLSIQVPEQ